MADIADVLLRIARRSRNCLLTGQTGVGKTTMVYFTFEDGLGLKRVSEIDETYEGGAYVMFNGALVDAQVQLLGIPVPGQTSLADPVQLTKAILDLAKTGIASMPFADAQSLVEQTVVSLTGGRRRNLDFLRPRVLDQVDALFMDEINRASVKTLNAVMEMIQFYSANSVKLPRLRMVWAARNPDDCEEAGVEYLVERMDPALIQRFHSFITLKGQPSVEWYVQKAGLKRTTADALKRYWEGLDPKHQLHLNPRRLEYIGEAHEAGDDIELYYPPMVDAREAGVLELKRTLATSSKVGLLSVDDLLDPLQKDEIQERMKADPQVMLHVEQLLSGRGGPAATKLWAYTSYIKLFDPETSATFFSVVGRRVLKAYPDPRKVDFTPVREPEKTQLREFLVLATESGIYGQHMTFA